MVNSFVSRCSSKDFSSYFECFGMCFAPGVAVMKQDKKTSKWTLGWEGGGRSFSNLFEVSAFASRMLLVPEMNQDIYLIVKAYFDGGSDDREDILNWIRSSGRCAWSRDGWNRCVKSHRTRLSIRGLPRLIKADGEARKRFGLQCAEEPLLQLDCDGISDPWYRGLLRRIRTEELKRLRATLPVASVESRPASRL
jgi:hypothetical protein